ncbi:glutathione S-transferase family protein [Pseudogemmobacter sp. W21_MBD1_M6]|uniref:glutathione S-transferase family protein n=1 Tax=Pseudogemmobacter sp. W21_MBD1_M6 TaxID=3240271 RepID=UPI003F9BEF27
MYKVIGNIRTRTLRVLWVLNELEQPFAHVAAVPGSAEAKAANPSGKVPVLLDGGACLTDSTAIIQYLADKHGTLTFPAGTIDRARQDGFTQMILDEVDGALWTAARHSFVLPEDMRIAEIKPSLKWEFARALSRLSGQLGDKAFLMGDTMTVPDIILAHCLGWATSAGFPVEDANLQAYAARLRDRAAFKASMGAA